MEISVEIIVSFLVNILSSFVFNILDARVKKQGFFVLVGQALSRARVFNFHPDEPNTRGFILYYCRHPF